MELRNYATKISIKQNKESSPVKRNDFIIISKIPRSLSILRAIKKQ